MVALFFFAFPAGGQAVDAAGGVKIQSDSLRIMDQSGEIQFEGQVRVDLEGARLTCERLLLQTTGEDPPEVLRGTATGGVVIIRGSDRVTAERARFDLRDGTVELSGSPRLERGDATISARRILYRLDEGTADFEGGVRAEFSALED